MSTHQDERASRDEEPEAVPEGLAPEVWEELKKRRVAGESIVVLANEAGVSQTRMAEVLRTAEVRPARLEERVPVEDILRRYRDEEESAASLAAEFGLTERFVFRLLDKHGIPRRGCVKELDMPIAELKRRYLEDRVELQDLAAMLGVSRGTVSRRLAEAGVTVPLGARPLDLPVDEILERRQRNETLKEIAAVYDVSVPTIRRRLDQAEKAAESA